MLSTQLPAVTAAGFFVRSVLGIVRLSVLVPRVNVASEPVDGEANNSAERGAKCV